LTEWNSILPEKIYSLEEPDASVVNFVKLLTKRKKKRVLDLACGAGRHVIHMAEQGLDIYGADLSETGLKMTKERLRKRNLTATLVKCDLNNLPYVSACFDAIICTRSIYHQKLQGIERTLSEIGRILRTKGFILVDFLSKRTYSYAKGKKVEENTFAEQAGPERGVLHHFTGRNELETLFKGFDCVTIELQEKEVKGKLRSRWTVQATV
jgi:ubiquinone/menaquinone biosynthesis C-methylase UbiE